MKRNPLFSFCLSLFLFAAVASFAQAQNWPQFRGPGATGVAETGIAPVKWDAGKAANLRWKTAIPGLGHSSPVA